MKVREVFYQNYAWKEKYTMLRKRNWEMSRLRSFEIERVTVCDYLRSLGIVRHFSNIETWVK